MTLNPAQNAAQNHFEQQASKATYALQQYEMAKHNMVNFLTTVHQSGGVCVKLEETITHMLSDIEMAIFGDLPGCGTPDAGRTAALILECLSDGSHAGAMEAVDDYFAGYTRQCGNLERGIRH